MKFIPEDPGVPTSPLRPGIPGKFIVSPGVPVLSRNERMMKIGIDFVFTYHLVVC